jgi:ATP-dependent Clp protease ATP-binding subunit ClpB
LTLLPQDIDQLEREIIQLEIERQALQRGKTRNQRGRFERRSNSALQDLKETSSGMKGQVQSEKEKRSTICEQLKRELEQLRLQLDQARNAGELGKASEIQIRGRFLLSNGNAKKNKTSSQTFSKTV